MTADCASCADERAAGAAFCEACGRSLTAAGPPCATCGADDGVDADGYCASCGVLAGQPRDHLELTAGPAAAVSDRGQRHHRNEDAVFLAARGADVDIVVCDGVSSSFDPDVASCAAATAAGSALASLTADDLDAGLTSAIAAALAAVTELATSGDPRRTASNPACTIVAACTRGSEIAYGWIGDSRAYWIPAEGDAEQLTEDDSWATQAIAMGADPLLAMSDPKAHAITGWLGADAGPVVARTGRLVAEVAGHLVVCSDGLWNYLIDHGDFADTVRKHLSEADDLAGTARALTAFANDCGGMDNITVAIAPVPAAAASPTEESFVAVHR